LSSLVRETRKLSFFIAATGLHHNQVPRNGMVTRVTTKLLLKKILIPENLIPENLVPEDLGSHLALKLVIPVRRLRSSSALCCERRELSFSICDDAASPCCVYSWNHQR
jgi:hypothetical protein